MPQLHGVTRELVAPDICRISVRHVRCDFSNVIVYFSRHIMTEILVTPRILTQPKGLVLEILVKRVFFKKNLD
jgi:hypothetical protein